MVRKLASSIANQGFTYIKSVTSLQKVGLRAASRARPLKDGTSLPKSYFCYKGLSHKLTSVGMAEKRTYQCNVAVSPQSVYSKTELPKEAHGFELIRREFVKEYNSDVLVYKHKKTGAELISLMNDDENKTFGIVFRTPIENSCGCPHILEHSLLGGSRKYNVKEPFVELIKGSLNTFLNAFTYPDRTCYPIASCNIQDFYNLVDVYMDAVFYPNVIRDKKIFLQEGWHYELENEKSPMTYKGVVYNEMKGVYSSPDDCNFRFCMKYLFPDNNYVYCSGGMPEEIVKLTHEEFKKYYQELYHPSNAKFWFYGDDEPLKRLEKINEFLSDFEAKQVSSEIRRQPLLKQPMRKVQKYASASSEKAYLTLNWVLTEETVDLETRLALGFLNYLLIGTPASSLHKKLIDSDLGESLIGGGITDEFLQPFMSIGLKGVNTENFQKVENLIMEELERLSKEGFSSSAIEAALNSIEFDLRENNTGRFPRGLSLMLRAAYAWNYGQDPVESLRWEGPLKKLKQKLSSGEPIFQEMIKKMILDNPHKLTFEMIPDAELGALNLAKEKRALIDIKESMSPEQINQVIKETEELKLWQETKDSPEDLKCIPVLKISDINKSITKIPTVISTIDNTTVLSHDLFTNDILYMELLMELRTLPENLIPLIPLFCQSMTQMGTEKESFVDLTERIGRKTGGIGLSPFISSKKGTSEPVAKISIEGKVTKEKIGDMTALMRDILLTARLDDRDRFKQMVLESKADYETAISSAGHSFAVRRLSAKDSIAGWINEVTGGLSYLDYLRDLAKKIESDWDSVLEDLKTIRNYVVNTNGSIVNMTADRQTLDLAMPRVEKFLESLPKNSHSIQHWNTLLSKSNEAFTVSTQVNYVGKAINMYKDTGYQFSGSSYVIIKHLYATWLWERVRARGGAYGCIANMSKETGLFTLASYRDPNFFDTLENYDGAVSYLKQLTLDEDARTKAIIGAMGDIDAYMLPDAKGGAALVRYLLGVTDEERQMRRDEVLSTSEKDFREFGEHLDALRSDKATVVAVVSEETAKTIQSVSPGFVDIKNYA